MRTLLEGSCLHDFCVYVLDDCECNSNCADYVTCGCETHHSPTPDDTKEFTLDAGDIHVKIIQ